VSCRPRTALVAALALIAGFSAASAQGQHGPQEYRQRRDGREEDYRRADTAAVVAAELAFARAAQDKGQWTAFAEYAAENAVMFVPQPVSAQAWLKGRANPPQAVRWQPHQVWSSCDGSLAVTKGAWQRPDGSVGYFTTVWQRQDKKKDRYRWVMDQGDALAEPLQAAEMIEGNVAECGQASSASETWDDEQADWEANSEAGGATVGVGESRDRTLAYRYSVLPSGARRTEVFLLKEGKMEQVLLSEVAAR
jgi:hypothetical protein